MSKNLLIKIKDPTQMSRVFFHLYKNTLNVMLNCPSCKKEFVSNGAFLSHMKENHGLEYPEYEKFVLFYHRDYGTFSTKTIQKQY